MEDEGFMTAEEKQEHRRMRAESDIRTLTEAREILKDKDRHNMAKEVLMEKVKAVKGEDD